MSFDFSTLVTDRTKADVDNKTEKGAYNASDLNRVTKASEYLNEIFKRYGYITGYEPIKIEHPSGINLPDGYTALAYIETTGTQYVDIDYKPSSKTSVVFDMDVLPSNTGNAHHLCTALAGGLAFTCRINADRSGFGMRFGSERLKTIPHSGDVFSRHTFELGPDGGSIDGNPEISFSFSDFQISTPLRLFGYTSATGATTEMSAVRLYSYRLYEDFELKRDLIPCIDADNQVCLFDLVSERAFKSAGSGKLIAGPPVAVDESLDPYTWYESDIPTELSMERYLQNVSGIRDAITVLKSTPDVPESMGQLTYDKANDIEKILLDVEKQIGVMESTFVACGPATCGGDYL